MTEPAADAAIPIAGATSALSRGVVAAVVQQHVEDATVLHASRSALLKAPHVKLHHLQRFDDRLAAHLDGLLVGGRPALALCEAALESPHPSALFVAAIPAIEAKNTAMLDRLIALVQALPECRSGLIAALGWMEREQLRGVVAGLLGSDDSARRQIGVAASAAHRIDPGLVAQRRCEDPDAAVRARALRAAGELGKCELVSTLTAALRDDDDATCRFWAAWSAVLLGDRVGALDYLKLVALAEGPCQARAWQLTLQASPVADARALLQQIARDSAQVSGLIRGAGFSGDPTYVPWLIARMEDDALARAAGEAFSMITGADLAELDLEREPPEQASGPNDDPEDADVAMDPDESLPWPDRERVQSWWTCNGGRFAAGTRHFLGAVLSRGVCLQALRSGLQRQRIAAAHYLCLLAPGTPLFEWRAPARRQQRELAQWT